jgi:hypothetical protein
MPAVRSPSQSPANMTLKGIMASGPQVLETHVDPAPPPVMDSVSGLEPTRPSAPLPVGLPEASRTDAPAFLPDELGEDGAPVPSTQQPRSRGPVLVAVAGVVVASLAVAGAYILGKAGKTDSHKPPSGQVASSSPEGSGPSSEPAALADAGAVVEQPLVRPGYHTHTVGEGGYSVRAEVPEKLDIGPAYDIYFTVLDPDGNPLADAQLQGTIEPPNGAEVPVSIPGAGKPGAYLLKRTFDLPGRYHFHLALAAGKNVVVWFDFFVGQETASAAGGEHHDQHGGGGAGSDPYHQADTASAAATAPAVPPVTTAAVSMPATKPAAAPASSPATSHRRPPHPPATSSGTSTPKKSNPDGLE